MRSITCTNHNGSTMIFTERAFTPFLLANVDGIYLASNEVSMSNNKMTDGATYQGSSAKKRNIVLTLMDQPNNVYNQRNRDALYVLFGEGTQGTLTYTEDGVSRVVTYYVEKIYKSSLKKRTITVSLLCADPFFYDAEDTNVQMANWISGFEFAHEFLAQGEELGYRSLERLTNIVNDTATDNIGITVTIDILSNVTNPSLTRVESDTHFKLGSTAAPLNLVNGDVVIITTHTNNKHVYLIHNGVKTEINQYITEDSVFIQLMRGNNNIGYSADAGDDYMSVTITYKMKYEGA